MTKETREEHKNKSKKQEQKEVGYTKNEKKTYLRRIFPIWLKILLALVLSLFALIIGLIIGFSVLGEGHPLDVLKWETWQHIIDLVTKQ